jgi:hypothetical protein
MGGRMKQRVWLGRGGRDALKPEALVEGVSDPRPHPLECRLGWLVIDRPWSCLVPQNLAQFLGAVIQRAFGLPPRQSSRFAIFS